MMKRKVVVNDKMQQGYTYYCTDPIGKDFHPEFKPELTPKEMLELGVFGGKYMTDCKEEFPNNWFENAKLSPEKKNPSLNYFGVEASMPLKHWQEKGWIYEEDPRGWFQWYARYFMGRRIPEEDERQIKRWKAFRRHKAAVEKNCKKGNLTCRKKQRQALLHWAYDSRKI
ncbi:MAG: hypothetical protein U9M98_01590 [Patescibacteria group bacterium]|nr:hypothetical protein [Patescibacteria group bacterium]